MNPRSFIRIIALILITAAAAPFPTAAAEAQGGVVAMEDKILGDWLLENAKGTAVSPMQIRRNQNGSFELVRLGGGPLAVCGEYKLDGSKLIKAPKPNDAYWDLTWQYAAGRLKLKKGDYKDWTLTRKEWKPRPGA